MKRTFYKITFGLLVTVSTAFSQVPTSGLVAYYPFNGNANDQSENGNNGIVNGASLTTDRNSITNTAYLFNGQSNYIDFGNSLNTIKHCTYSAWFNIDAISNTYSEIITKEGNFVITVNNLSELSVFVGDSLNWSAPISCTNPIIQVKNWYNVVSTVDTAGVNQVVKIYLNGSLSYASTISQQLGRSNFHLSSGAKKDKISNIWENFFKGKIDDIKIWNRALSANEVTALYNEGTVTGINNNDFNNDFIKIYPNPARDLLNIQINNLSDSYTIKIIDITGKPFYSDQINTINQQIYLSQLCSKGLYFMQILDRENKIIDVKKLVIE